jgi:hypothetical protein
MTLNINYQGVSKVDMLVFPITIIISLMCFVLLYWMTIIGIIELLLSLIPGVDLL